MYVIKDNTFNISVRNLVEFMCLGGDSVTGTVVAGPDVLSRGFVYVRDSENLMEEIKKLLRAKISEFEEKHITDWSTIKSLLREELRDYIYKKTKRDPMILPIIMEV